MEDLNLRPEVKVNLMVAVLALLYMLAIQEGIVHLEANPGIVKLKTYKVKFAANDHAPAHVRTVKYPEISLFRLGADLVNGPLLIDMMTKLLTLTQL